MERKGCGKTSIISICIQRRKIMSKMHPQGRIADCVCCRETGSLNNKSRKSLEVRDDPKEEAFLSFHALLP